MHFELDLNIYAGNNLTCSFWSYVSELSQCSNMLGNHVATFEVEVVGLPDKKKWPETRHSKD